MLKISLYQNFCVSLCEHIKTQRYRKKLIQTNFQHLLMIYNYGPIKKLCDIGFSTDMPSGGILPKKFKTPNDSEIFQTINNIEREDNCTVS